MNIADIFILCIVAPFALAGILLAVCIGIVIILLVIGFIKCLCELWAGFWADKLAELDEGEQWKK